MQTALPIVAPAYPEAYTIRPAAYTKGKYVITPHDSRDGWKGIASYACDDIGLHYVNRSQGYTASPSQVRRFEAAYAIRRAQSAARNEA